MVKVYPYWCESALVSRELNKDGIPQWDMVERILIRSRNLISRDSCRWSTLEYPENIISGKIYDATKHMRSGPTLKVSCISVHFDFTLALRSKLLDCELLSVRNQLNTC